VGTMRVPCLSGSSTGDALLFDHRVQHCGLANISGAGRPIPVLTFAKPFFRDILNFPPKRSIHGVT